MGCEPEISTFLGNLKIYWEAECVESFSLQKQGLGVFLCIKSGSGKDDRVPRTKFSSCQCDGTGKPTSLPRSGQRGYVTDNVLIESARHFATCSRPVLLLRLTTPSAKFFARLNDSLKILTEESRLSDKRDSCF